jgi:hypothetical protein
MTWNHRLREIWSSLYKVGLFRYLLSLFSFFLLFSLFLLSSPLVDDRTTLSLYLSFVDRRQQRPRCLLFYLNSCRILVK